MKITKPTFISTNTDGIYVKTDDSKYLNKHDVAIAYSEMIDALIDMCSMYKELVDSGDCGHWDARDIVEYENAINALKKAGCTYEH